MPRHGDYIVTQTQNKKNLSAFSHVTDGLIDKMGCFFQR